MFARCAASRCGGRARTTATRATSAATASSYSRHDSIGRTDFTKNRFKVTRGPYRSLDEEHIAHFRSFLAPSQLVTDLSDLGAYNVDWTRHLRGSSRLALRPKSAAEVSQILAYCNANKLAVCVQGGNTSFAGGSVPVLDEIVLSTSALNRVLSVDATAGTLVCEAGCVLEQLEGALRAHALQMPLDLGAKGSCQIGGNVATNAGGVRFLRYGGLHANLLGLEVVLADGQLLDLLTTLKKDNTGYHLKNVFVGSEGTLGVITKVALACPVRSPSVHVLLLGLASFARVLETFRQARRALGEIVSSVEVMDADAVRFVGAKLGVRSPIGDHPFYLLLETAGSSPEHDEAKVAAFLEHALAHGLVLDGTLASDERRMRQLWAVRERIPEAFPVDPHVFSYDFTLPLPAFYQLVDEARAHLGHRASAVFGLGHVADGNLHLQIAYDEFVADAHRQVERMLMQRVADLKGSISAEHGIGFLKREYLKDFKPSVALRQMRQLKRLMDPNGILNPYKTIYPDNSIDADAN